MAEKYMNIPGDYYENAHYNSTKSQEFMYISRESYFIEFMGLKGTETILDIGCGSGTFAAILAKKYPNAKIFAMDLSQAEVSFAKKSKQGIINLCFAAASINKLPIKECFDVIIMSHIIEHIENPANALNEALLGLKKDGKLFVTTPNYFSLWPLAELVFDKFFAAKEYGYSLGEQHISRFNYWSLIWAMKKSGFRVETTRTLYIISLQASLLSKKIAWLLFKIDKFLGFLPFGMIIYSKAAKASPLPSKKLGLAETRVRQNLL